jgi:hypothetical protein
MTEDHFSHDVQTAAHLAAEHELPEWPVGAPSAAEAQRDEREWQERTRTARYIYEGGWRIVPPLTWEDLEP